jgi:hypothetical protein
MALKARGVIVEVGDMKLVSNGGAGGFHMKVDITTQLDMSENFCRVVIEGMSKTSIKKLLAFPAVDTLVSVQLGREKTLDAAFLGRLKSATFRFGQGSSEVAIEAIDAPPDGQVTVKNKKGKGIVDAFKDGAKELLGGKGITDAGKKVLSSATGSQDVVMTGSPVQVIEELGRQYGFIPYYQNEQIRFMKPKDESKPSASLTFKTGLLESPVTSASMTKIRCIFDPRIQLGRFVEVDSNLYLVTRLTHECDSHAGPWFTVAEGIIDAQEEAYRAQYFRVLNEGVAPRGVRR